MTHLRITMVGDGSSDRCLRSPIEWLLSQFLLGQEVSFKVEAATPEGTDLASRLRRACEQFPCDLLFAHRDAERESVEKRHQEIRIASGEAGITKSIPVVPVRMTEAWLLIDEMAIRKAADNPAGYAPLPLPSLQQLESIPDPKEVLRRCLLEASEKQGRHLKRFRRDLGRRSARVAELIEDYEPLRKLPAFQTFEKELTIALATLL